MTMSAEIKALDGAAVAAHGQTEESDGKSSTLP
jgi:hypothetical protein